jgi:hypothetical protein
MHWHMNRFPCCRYANPYVGFDVFTPVVTKSPPLVLGSRNQRNISPPSSELKSKSTRNHHGPRSKLWSLDVPPKRRLTHATKRLDVSCQPSFTLCMHVINVTPVCSVSELWLVLSHLQIVKSGDVETRYFRSDTDNLPVWVVACWGCITRVCASEILKNITFHKVGLCWWYISITIKILDIIHHPVLYLKLNVSETGFCLRLLVEPTQLSPINSSSYCG